MEGGGIKIRAVGPDEGPHFGIDTHLVENRQVKQRAKKFAGEDWSEVNHLFGGIIEFNAQCIRSFDAERSNAM